MYRCNFNLQNSIWNALFEIRSIVWTSTVWKLICHANRFGVLFRTHKMLIHTDERMHYGMYAVYVCPWKQKGWAVGYVHLQFWSMTVMWLMLSKFRRRDINTISFCLSPPLPLTWCLFMLRCMLKSIQTLPMSSYFVLMSGFCHTTVFRLLFNALKADVLL